MSNPHLSIVIPAYNEEALIEASVRRFVAYLSSTNRNWELLVVSDGSTDRTPEIVRALAEADPRVRLIDAPHGGKGAAVRRGMLEAKGDWRFLSDADLSMPPEQIERFFDGPGGEPPYDVVIGSREAAGAQRFDEPWIRHFIGRAFNWTVCAVAVRGIQDTQCGFKLFSGAAAAAVFPRQLLDGFAFDVEILFLARKAGFSVGEVAIDWQHYGDSKVSFANGALAFVDILRVRLNEVMGRYRGMERVQ